MISASGFGPGVPYPLADLDRGDRGDRGIQIRWDTGLFKDRKPGLDIEFVKLSFARAPFQSVILQPITK